MKVALLGDTHWGARNDNKIVAEYQIRFYKEVFFPELEKRRISTIIQLGDLVDRRKYINYHTLHNMKEHLFNVIDNWHWKDNPTHIGEPIDGHGSRGKIKNPDYRNGMTFIGFPGNHDIAQKESTKINSFEELFNVPGVSVAESEGQYSLWWITAPTQSTLGEHHEQLKVLYLPWICDENREDSMRAIERSDARVAFGHLELAGFEMQKGQLMPFGMEAITFDKFELVVSGHYHSAQRRGNILYTGTPYELTWADWNDQKGFWILDTVTLETEFVPNPITLHAKVFYDETRADFKKWSAGKFEEVKDKFVKIVVQNRVNNKAFNKFVDKIEKAGAITVQVIDLPLDLSNVSTKPIMADEHVELFDMIEDVIIQANLPNQDKVIGLMRELYEEATQLT